MAEAEFRESGQSVTARALSILAAFENTTGSLSVARIAQRSGLPLSTTYRLISELEEWGGLRRGSDGKYQIGFRIWELGQMAGRRLRDRAHPFLQDLFDLAHENVHMAIREGVQSLYVDKIYGTKKMPQISRLGGRLPLHATAVGRVLLASQPDWFVDAYLERELEAPTPKTVTDPDVLREVIAEVRQTNYSVTHEQMRLDAMSLAVPVIFNNAVVAAVGLVFDANRSREVQRLLPMLKGTVERIELVMRGGPAGLH
ncbi:MAG: HTH-type transcriptional regulator KipR [Actinomycetota bacterium]|jgi:DNA-binding IclR family transcriptional regulator